VLCRASRNVKRADRVADRGIGNLKFRLGQQACHATISSLLPPNTSTFWCSHEVAAATSLAPDGQGLAGASR
jgi:hypothetical protein